MEKTTDVEQFYDYLDQCALALHANDKTPYLNGVALALDFLLDDALPEETPDDVVQRLREAKTQVIDQNFDKETVRKAIQLALLKGFKSLNVTNSMMTPDTIGMFMSYLLKKLYGENSTLTVFDPLVGPGNLLATINNHHREGHTFIGTDIDPLLCQLSRNVLDALDIKHQIYHQDTRTFEGLTTDLIVCDFPVEKKNRKEMYFPYQIILKHMHQLKPYGFFVAVIENDFFDQKEATDFKKKLLKTMHLYGLIKLDEGLFKNHPKSILILQKKQTESETLSDFLLADLPSFSDETAFNKTIEKIELWFKNRKVD